MLMIPRRSRQPLHPALVGLLIVSSLIGYGLLIGWAILSALGETPDDEE